MKSTQAMRDRIRELMSREQDDYDRAVECVLDDLESLMSAPAQAEQESLSPQIEALIPFSSAADGIPPNLPDEFEILLKIDATPFARVTVGEFRATRHALTASQPSPAATVKPFYGAECPSYPNCKGGCGLGCTHEVEQRKRSSADSGSVPDREAFWLVERIGHGQYVKDRSEMPGLTSDPWRAARFSTEREAHDLWLRLSTLRDECKPVEHMFINKISREEPQPSADNAQEIASVVARLRNFVIWNARHSHYDPVPLGKEAADLIERLTAAPQRSAGNVADLIDRLRNPMWAHSTVPFPGPQLEQEENLAAMNEAAAWIERMNAEPQEVKVTDAMVKAGAAAMCCQAQTLGCAAQQSSSEFSTCMLGSFMLDARSCLDAALALSRPQSECK